ncbi:hypothetical protein Y1Q_0000579 [Alligator mississippiensis]|uniref:Uncharacterized protein n=1 Tax=Alligator mississippiensis TaxID=8496 RepID=A0A151MBX5_ALLMI|nr:hypothetical protein Y1Q_0000579 [Alligator mississippiensis]
MPELVEQVPEGGPGHPKGVQPPLIILGLLDEVLPPVLAGVEGPEAVGLEAQEGDGHPSGGIMEPLVGAPGGGSYAAAVALG